MYSSPYIFCEELMILFGIITKMIGKVYYLDKKKSIPKFNFQFY